MASIPANTSTGLNAWLAYLNSSMAYEIICLEERTLAGGLLKLEPTFLKNIYVVDLQTLSKGIKSTLAGLFVGLRETKRQDEPCIAVLDEIDAVLQHVM